MRLIATPSHLIVGAVTGIDAHGKTARALSATADICRRSLGRLCIIRTGFAGDSIRPSLIAQIPLLAVHEKSPLIGFTGYVYHSLLTKSPFLVSLIMASRFALPMIVMLCGIANGIGSELRPSGEPSLDAFPDDAMSSLYALYESEYVFSKTPFRM